MKPIAMYVAILALAIAAPAGAAFAQDRAQQDWESGPRGYGFMGPGMMGYGPGHWRMGWAQGMCRGQPGHIEGRLAYIKVELKITEAQEPLWKAYANAARENGDAMLARCAAMMGQRDSAALTLPERLDLKEQLMAAQLDSVRALDKALKPLYAALNDEQKKSADQMFWGPMGMM